VRRIDLHHVLRQTVSARYGDLVTRRTGQAVRSGIEAHLAALDERDVAIIDFTGVRCMDFSCADEVVGKLLLAHGEVRYFLLRGVNDGQRVAIEQILEVYDLAVVVEDADGRLTVLGRLSEPVRRAFQVLADAGTTAVDEVAGALDLPDATVRDAVAELVRRRLAIAATASGKVVALA